MLKDAKEGRITGLRISPVTPKGAPLKEVMEAFILVQVETMGEPQPRKDELHMDKIKPSYLLRRFKAMASYGCEYPFLYKLVNGVGTYLFTDDYFRKLWAWRLQYGEPK